MDGSPVVEAGVEAEPATKASYFHSIYQKYRIYSNATMFLEL